MTGRYEIASEWVIAYPLPVDDSPLTIECADLRDTNNGHVYTDGAYRIVNTLTGKPAVRGNGGTVPFKGEMAWASAQRLFMDLMFRRAVNL